MSAPSRPGQIKLSETNALAGNEQVEPTTLKMTASHLSEPVPLIVLRMLVLSLVPHCDT